MIIILEGENKTGKTTLAKYICEEYDFEYVKCNQPDGDPFVEYMTKLDNAKGKNVVFDRFHIGEMVYGKIQRGKPMMDKTQVRKIELRALSLGALMIYTFDDFKSIGERFVTEKEENAKISEIEKILLEYEFWIRKSIIPTINHQMKSDNDLFINKEIIHLLIRQQYEKL